MKDALGNELQVGQLVQVNLDRPQVFGRVAAIEGGGIVTGMKGGKPEVRPAKMTVVCNHTFLVEPGAVTGSVLALVDPDPPSPDSIVRLADAASRPN